MLFRSNTGLARGFVLKYDNNGNVLWQNFYQTSGVTLNFYSVDIDSSQNYIYCLGSYQSASSALTCVVKIDSSGNTIWGVDLTGSSIDLVYPAYQNNLSVTQDGNIYVGGSYVTDSGLSNQLYWPMVWKLNSSGTTYWKKTIGNGAIQNPPIVRAKPTPTDSGLALIGPQMLPSDYVPVMSLDQNGNILWQKWSENLSAFLSTTRGLGLRVDNTGNIYGLQYDSGDSTQLGLWKCDFLGNLIWKNYLPNLAPGSSANDTYGKSLALNQTAKTVLIGTVTESDNSGFMGSFVANLDAYGTGTGTYQLGSNVTYTLANTQPYQFYSNLTFTTANLTITNANADISNGNITSLILATTGNLTTYTNGTVLTLSNTSVNFGNRR